METPSEKNDNSAQFISLERVGKLFDPPVSKVTLYKWMGAGTLNITAYKIGGRVFYNKIQVLNEIKNNIKP